MFYIVFQRYQILNPDDHATFLRKQNKDPYNFRPDIVHEVSNLVWQYDQVMQSGQIRSDLDYEFLVCYS